MARKSREPWLELDVNFKIYGKSKAKRKRRKRNKQRKTRVHVFLRMLLVTLFMVLFVKSVEGAGIGAWYLEHWSTIEPVAYLLSIIRILCGIRIDNR